MRIQCPCGLVTTTVEVADGRAGRVRFASVPAFAFARDAVVVSGPFGPVTLDIGYGGAFYGVLPASALGLDLERSPVSRLVEAAMAIKHAAAAQIPLSHPDSPDLAYFYGVILTDDTSADPDAATTNVCVFADGQVDRSPTGSGVTARLALMHRRREVATGQSRRFRSITGGEFVGRVLSTTRAGPHPAVMVEVAGEAFFTGEAMLPMRASGPSGRRLPAAAVSSGTRAHAAAVAPPQPERSMIPATPPSPPTEIPPQPGPELPPQPPVELPGLPDEPIIPPPAPDTVPTPPPDNVPPPGREPA